MNKASSINFCQSFLGKKINRLTIIDLVPILKGKGRVMAICECGMKKDYVLSAIISGNTTSCGCYNKSKGVKHGHHNHPLYSVWRGIKSRCYVESSSRYYTCGALGVKMCDEWVNDFGAFYNWAISNGWERGLQVDKDILSKEKPGKLYSPNTCLFVTSKVNNNHTTRSRILTYNGVSMSVQDWAEKISIPHITIRSRLNNGWSHERALTTPVYKHTKRSLK